jgi:hypothetical protein
MDSGGKAETSRGRILPAVLDLETLGFAAECFFRKTCFTIFVGLGADLARRASFLAARFDGFVFRVGMGRYLLQV